MSLLRRLPDFVLNGIAVAAGIGVIQLLMAGLAGAHAAQLALSGAVCASLADVPNTVSRTWQRVAAAAALSILAALVVDLLKPHPLALGAGVGAISFVAMLAMAWGARAGAVSFAPVLALVFSMAVPVSSEPLLALAGWNALGAACYLAWSVLASLALQHRYRTLALVRTLRATAQLLQSRAALLDVPHPQAVDAAAMRAWIQGEAELAERLQSARDFVFAAADSPRARRDTAMLLRAIELRDVLLASRLDLELFGSDAAGRAILQRVAQALRGLGTALDAAALALRDGRPAPPLEAGVIELRGLFADAEVGPGDPRARLLPAVTDRLRSIAADVIRIHALLDGEADEVPLTRAQLQRFVAPEGWPLQALRAQLTLRSPVLRHAVRAALALSGAYFLALALPWASHPHWLVLSVAVVLRGNLEQTLTRRNARVLGTLLGCAVVLGLAHALPPEALGGVFLLAVGTAHAFVMQRYWLTATAATVMALLQSHMVDPAGGFAIAERVADTLLGAALAWGFSYVLPAWERRSLPRAVARVLQELRGYAIQAVNPQTADAIEQRLARRQAYDALNALATALQRSAAEPKAVQVPVREVAALIDHGQRLMAHLSMVRLILARRGGELKLPAAEVALQQAATTLAGCLTLAGGAEPSPAPGGATPDGSSVLPMQAPADDVLPWLLRRLQLLVADAGRIRAAARRAVALVQAPGI